MSEVDRNRAIRTQAFPHLLGALETCVSDVHSNQHAGHFEHLDQLAALVRSMHKEGKYKDPPVKPKRRKKKTRSSKPKEPLKPQEQQDHHPAGSHSKLFHVSRGVAHPQVKQEKAEEKLDSATWDRLNMMKRFMYVSPPQQRDRRARPVANEDEQSWEKELEELEDEEHDYDAAESPAMVQRDAIKKTVEYIERIRVSLDTFAPVADCGIICRRRSPHPMSECWNC
jgi:hypothetical protein